MAYAPAGNLTSTASLGHLQALYYKRRGLDRLQKKFKFHEVCEHDILPKQQGRTVVYFRYRNFSALTTPTSEGTVGNSQTMGSNVLQCTVSQYSAFITVSDLLRDTSIDPIVESAAELLGYQAGLSVDTIMRNVIDAESANTDLALIGSVLKVQDLRNARHQLQALDVQPFDDNEFRVILHPYSSFDLVNDPAAGGLADIVKYTAPANSPLVKYEDRGTVTRVAGCRVEESTNVKVISGTPNKYRVYVFGKGAVGCVDLEGRGPSYITDPNRERFKINVIPGSLSVANPEGTIGGVVSYNFVFNAVVLDGPAGIGGTYRYRTLDAPSSIG